MMNTYFQKFNTTCM